LVATRAKREWLFFRSSAMSSADAAASIIKETRSLQSSVDHARLRIKALDKAITEDLNGRRALEIMQTPLHDKKSILEKRIEKNKAWIGQLDKEMDSFQGRYNDMIETLGALSTETKQKVETATKKIQGQLKYHSTFKRWDDEM